MNDIAEQTRRVYHLQHSRIAADDRAMKRFIGMFSHDYFGLDQSFFENAKCLDAGCGDTAKLLIALYRLGCQDIHGFDLGDEFIPVARASLEARGVPAEAVSLKSGSVTDIPYPDNTFDFTACHGVLPHLNDIEDTHAGFRELARVTKPGGYVYTVFGLVGGFFEDCIIPAVREYYRTNDEFRTLIDNVAPEHFGSAIDVIEEGLRKHESANADLSFVRDLLDTDLCVLFQNAIQCPVRMRIDEETIRGMYADAGFEEPRRLRRYVKRENIRRYMAPLHYEREHPISRILYGSGNLEFIAKKA